MNYLMGRKCGGSRDQGFNDWEKVTAIQDISILVHQSGDERTLYWVCGMRMKFGVMTKKVSQPRLSPTLRTSTLLQTQTELMK